MVSKICVMFILKRGGMIEFEEHICSTSNYKVGSDGVISDVITPLYRGHDPSETHLFSAISRGPTLSHLSLVAHLVNPNCRSTNPQIRKGSITTAREKCNCISANHGAGEG